MEFKSHGGEINAEKDYKLYRIGPTHVALTVEDSADLVNIMKDNDVDYWDRLLVDRNLYQIFIQDPNGVIIELNDYKPKTDKINPITIIK